MRYAAAAFLMLAAPCLAGIDYTTFEARVAITNAQIRAHTGQSIASFITVGTGPDGTVYLYTRNAAVDFGAKLVAVDVSGPTRVFTTVATQADLLPHMDSVAPQAFNIAADSNGVVYFQEFVETGQIDDILRIVPGAPPSVTNLRRINGIAGVALSRAGDFLYITQADNFLAPSNNFVRIPTAGGADQVVASSAAIAAVSGGSQAGLRCAPAETSAGNFLAWDEADFQGADALLQITPAGTASVVRSAAAWDGGSLGGVIAMGTDAADTLFAWNQFPSSGGTRLHIIPDAGTGTPIKHTKASIDAALTAAVGSAYAYSMIGYGNGMALHSTPTQTVVYLADLVRGDVVALTFNALPSSANGWHVYE